MSDPIRTPHVPVDHTNEREHRRLLSYTLNRVIEGGLNSIGSVTLETNQTTTTITNKRIGANSVILLVPTNADSRDEHPAVTSKSDGSATLTHANPGSSTTHTFDYVIIG